MLHCQQLKGLHESHRRQVKPQLPHAGRQFNTHHRLAAKPSITTRRTTTTAKDSDINLEPPTDRADCCAAAATAATAEATDTGVGRCPVLNAMLPPMSRNVPWYKRLMQMTHPRDYQKAVLGDETVVQVPEQLGLPAMFVVGSADAARTILGKEGSLTQMYPFLRTGGLAGEGALSMVTKSSEHKQLRMLLQPAFTADAVNRMVPEVVTSCEAALHDWAAAGARGKGVPSWPGITGMTFSVITRVMLGNQVDGAEVGRLHQKFECFIDGLVTWPQIDLPFTAFGKARKARQELLATFHSFIQRARALVARGGEVPGALGLMVSAVDEEGNTLNDDLIAENMLLALFAGYDTTSTVLGELLVMLQDCPTVMDKLRQEQQRVVAAYGEELSPAALGDMPYLTACTRECMRLKPVGVDFIRTAVQDFDLGQTHVPKGTHLMVANTLIASQDPLWRDASGELAPEVFNPERFMTAEAIKSPWQLAFGHGPRHCLGYHLAMMELKVFFALLARGYSYKVDANTTWRQQVGRTPLNGLPLVMTPVEA